MTRTSLRPPIASRHAAVILAFLAASGPPALGAPGAPTTAQKVQVALPSGPPISPEAEARLKKVGLSPRDPQFAAKLKTLAASTGGAYVRTHVMRSTAAKTGGSHVAAPAGAAAGGGGVGRLSSLNRSTRVTLPVQGTVVAAYDDAASLLPNPVPISATHGKKYPGRYFFLVETKQKVATQGGPMFSFGNTSMNYGCSAQLGIVMTRAAAADDPNFTYGLAKHSPANGTFWYYVDVEFSSLPIGRERTAQTTFTFENASAATTLDLEPTPGTVTIAVTIDHSPQLTGVGYVYPWGSAGLSGANAKLGSPSTARVGGGDWQTQTQGDDLVGVGVGLGPGWTVTSAKVSSAVSATSPQDLSADNTWRGANVTTPPAGSDLRTAVHWHYSGIDSLDYTIEWTLSGPLGQRPILTLPKYGSCDS